jgi:hypothetical protein
LFGHVQRIKENRISKRVLYMHLETTRLRGRPRNRWQDEVGDDGRIVGGEKWQEIVYNREEWTNSKELSHSAHANGMNEFTNICQDHFLFSLNRVPEVVSTLKHKSQMCTSDTIIPT